MNRNFITKLTGVCLILFVSLLFMTCNPGLGKAVDTQPPKVAVEYPVTKSVLKGGFTMEGIATDEVKIVSCTVTFKNIKTSKEYKFPAETADGRFSVSINDPNPDGSFDIPDGDYNVTVSVSDAYRNATADVVYTIDNTSPTVLITSPNAYISSNWPDMYKTVTIKGEVFDANTISQVEVFIIDKNGNRLVSQIADGTSSFVATFSEPAIEDGEYEIYVALNSNEILHTSKVSLKGVTFEKELEPRKLETKKIENIYTIDSPTGLLFDNEIFKEYARKNLPQIDVEDFETKKWYLDSRPLRGSINDFELNLTFEELEALIEHLNKHEKHVDEHINFDKYVIPFHKIGKW